MSGSSRAVSEAALRDLLSAARHCASGPLSPDPLELLDLDACSREARAFKLDVSFALRVDGVAGARFSVNDKGEPEAFRRRVLAAAERLGVSREILKAFFELSPAGEVQTTLGIKWPASGRSPERVSLYLDELTRTHRALPLMKEAATLAGARIEPIDGAQPASAGIDLHGDDLVAFKDYWMAVEHGERAAVILPSDAERHRRRFPVDPERGTRRYLFARRHRRGEIQGCKLMFMSEAHHATAAQRAWALVDSIIAELKLPPSQPVRALASLRERWGHGDCYLYPDVISLDDDVRGEVEALVLYVSVK